ncbi:cyanase [Oceanibaculum indicum]|uniref:Cyanate hydratase n=2 Tax=Oceanibaculum indicum TaxID=526216 RepID=K2J545_9PROT|nr:cyanase [Oceanibaculum indicum]EKE78141.1 cyanate hydratase [Oceanibaculum indicum P24]RKQ73591.1 cyanate lyase [Oceanibaculum indicum]
MTREELTAKIRDIKIAKGLKWKDITAKAEGLSKEYATAALMGQMPLPEPAAKAVGAFLGLDDFEVKLLQQVPYRGSLPTAVPTDPLIYRFYELVNVYGSTFKALIEEEFGDGIMSAIDFKMDLKREPDPAGDRVSITMSGKFLKYKMY